MRALAFDVERDHKLACRFACLDLGFDAGGGPDRAHQLEFPASPRRRGQSKHRDRLEQVGLALAVGPDEYIDARPRRQFQLRVVPMIAET